METPNLNTAIVKGSLSSIAKAKGITTGEAFANAKLIVLLDTSASMSRQDAPGGQERYRAAVNQLAKLQAERQGEVVVVSWSTHAQYAPNGIPAFLGESTDLANALKFVKHADGLFEFCVISDGEPDDEKAALAIASKFKSKISTIYIGPEDGAGRDFLRRLAATAKGTSGTCETQNLNLLSESVAKLLPA